MPLEIYNHAKSQNCDHSQQFSPLVLKGEIATKDIFVTKEDEKNYPRGRNYLLANFYSHTPWDPYTHEYSDYSKKLARFLNDKEKIKGPYYVSDNPYYGQLELSIILFLKSDIDIFKIQYSDWDYDDTACLKNANTLSVWQEKGRFLSDPSLYQYSKT